MDDFFRLGSHPQDISLYKCTHSPKPLVQNTSGPKHFEEELSSSIRNLSGIGVIVQRLGSGLDFQHLVPRYLNPLLDFSVTRHTCGAGTYTQTLNYTHKIRNKNKYIWNKKRDLSFWDQWFGSMASAVWRYKPNNLGLILHKIRRALTPRIVLWPPHMRSDNTYTYILIHNKVKRNPSFCTFNYNNIIF